MSIGYSQERRCELCERRYDVRDYRGRAGLVGICPNCAKHLSGGKYSCRAVQTEARAMKGGAR